MIGLSLAAVAEGVTRSGKLGRILYLSQNSQIEVNQQYIEIHEYFLKLVCKTKSLEPTSSWINSKLFSRIIED